MISTTLALSNYVLGPLILLFLIISLAMILVVLIQKPQGGGLSGAFGAASDGGAGQTAFGARTGDALTTVTVTIFLLFLLTAIGLNYLIQPPSAPVAQPAAASPANGAATTTPDGATSEEGTGAADASAPAGTDPSPVDGAGRTGPLTGQVDVIDNDEPSTDTAPPESGDTDGDDDAEAEPTE